MHRSSGPWDVLSATLGVVGAESPRAGRCVASRRHARRSAGRVGSAAGTVAVRVGLPVCLQALERRGHIKAGAARADLTDSRHARPRDNSDIP